MEIQDKILNPFIIRIDRYNNTLIRKAINKDTGKEFKETIGYYSKLTSALSKIVKLKRTEGDATYSLLQYFDMLSEINGKFQDELKSIDVSNFKIEKIVYKTKTIKQKL